MVVIAAFKRTDCNYSETMVAGPLSFKADAGGLESRIPRLPRLSVARATPPNITSSTPATSESAWTGLLRARRLLTIGLTGPCLRNGRTVRRPSPRQSAMVCRSSTRRLSGAPRSLGSMRRRPYGSTTDLGSGSASTVTTMGLRTNRRELECLGSNVLSTLGGKTYFSVAVLPTVTDSSVAARTALADAYAPYAYAFVTNSKVTWDYQQQTSKVVASYARHRCEGGTNRKTVVATVPHQTDALVGADPISQSYVSPRGKMTVQTNVDKFVTQETFSGVLPELPTVGLDAAMTAELRAAVTPSRSRTSSRLRVTRTGRKGSWASCPARRDCRSTRRPLSATCFSTR